MLAGLPEPTRPGTSNNFDSLPRREDFNDKFDVKVDHQFSSRMTMFGRYSHRNLDNFEPPPIPGETGSPANAFVHVKNQQGAAGFTFTVTPTSLLEVRLGVSEHQGRQGASGRRRPERCSTCTGSPGCRPIRASRAGSPSRALAD